MIIPEKGTKLISRNNRQIQNHILMILAESSGLEISEICERIATENRWIKSNIANLVQAGYIYSKIIETRKPRRFFLSSQNRFINNVKFIDDLEPWSVKVDRVKDQIAAGDGCGGKNDIPIRARNTIYSSEYREYFQG